MSYGENDHMCALSSSLSSEIVITRLKKDNISHHLISIESYKQISKGEGCNEAHRIMPRYDLIMLRL